MFFVSPLTASEPLGGLIDLKFIPLEALFRYFSTEREVAFCFSVFSWKLQKTCQVHFIQNPAILHIFAVQVKETPYLSQDYLIRKTAISRT